MIQGMNHFTVLAEDLEKTLAFYAALGLQPGWRPPLDFLGAWLYVDGKAVLHVVSGRRMPEPRAGVIDHMAFSARGLKEVMASLEAQGIQYDLRRLAGGGQWQLFCHDPNGARVELDFDEAEAT